MKKRMLTAVLAVATMVLAGNMMGQTAWAAASATQLRESANRLDEAYKQLSAMKGQMVQLNNKFLENQQNNLAKLYIKGVLDIYDKVSAPGGWTDVVGLGYSFLEKAVSDPEPEKVRTQALSKGETSELRGVALKVLQSRGRIERMVTDYAKVLAAPLERFDDDKPALRSTKYWWRYEPDFKKDDNRKLVLRRGWVINGLGAKIVEVMERELASIAMQRKKLLTLAAKLEQAKGEDWTAARKPDPNMSWESVEMMHGGKVRVFTYPKRGGHYIYEPRAQQSGVGDQICKALGGAYETGVDSSYNSKDNAVDMSGRVVCGEDCLVFQIVYCGGFQ